MTTRFPDLNDDSFDPELLMHPRTGHDGHDISWAAQKAEVEDADDGAPGNQGPDVSDTDDDIIRENREIKKSFGFLADKRIPLFAGIFLLLVCLYVLVVSASYFYNLSHDQSALLSGIFDPAQYVNAGGPVGAWVAHFLLYDWLGLGSLVIVFYVFMIASSLLKVVKIDFWNLTFRCLLVAVAISIVGGFITYNLSSPIYWGGRQGHYLNERLISLAGIWGALAVSLAMTAAVILLFIYRIKAAFSWVVGKAKSANARRRELRQARQESGNEDVPSEASEQSSEPKSSEPHNDEDVPSLEETLWPDNPENTIDTPSQSRDSESPVDEGDLKPLFGLAEPSMVVSTPQIEKATTDAATRSKKSKSKDETPLKTTLDHRGALPDYHFPSLDLMLERESTAGRVDPQEMEENKQRIIKTLGDYGIPISHIHATVGATVTLYEIIPAEGVRIAKIKRLEDDIAMSLAALGIRIIAPIPGKGTIGIEVPNKDPQTVPIKSILGSKKFQETHMDLPMAMGTTISNDVFMADLCKMPHLLVAGATGMGKSVGLNTIIASLLYTKHPTELKFVLVDPKMVEFSLYASIEKQYLAKLPEEEDAIITDPAKVVATLNSLCVEMDNRYSLLKDAGVRNVKEYNEKFERELFRQSDSKHRYLPYIVVVVDEFADLIMTAGKEVETPIARIAQKARAVGMHMILATQRPSTNVITGIIKANFPGRVAFRVFQMVDSRTILDRPGANQLIGRGDMLFSNNGKIERVQCAFIDTPEVENLCKFISGQPNQGSAYVLPEYIPESDLNASAGGSPMDRDPLFEEAARLVVTTDTASTSSLQRRYSIGYNRAGKIMDQMEAAGIVGPSQGGKPRQVLVDPAYLERILENN